MSFLETQPIIRTVRGVEVPAAGPWSIDPGHAEVAFIGRHFMMTKVRGRFTDVTGVVHVGDDPAESTVELTDPSGGERAIFSASTEINREDWGLTWNMALETGGVPVSKKIRIEIEIETIRQR